MSLLRLTYRPSNTATAALRKRVILMFVLVWITAGGASAAVLPASSMNNTAPGTALIFYTQQTLDDDMWPLLFQVLRQDLAAGAGNLPNGMVLDKEPTILRGTDDLQGVSFSSIVSVRLLGRCDLRPQTDGSSPGGPLGWVVRVSGRIQPFIYIDCARIAREVRPAAAGMSKVGRDHVMAQAMSHVLIHEWAHIAEQSSAHGRRGLTQAYLSLSDLTAAPKEGPLSASNR